MTFTMRTTPLLVSSITSMKFRQPLRHLHEQSVILIDDCGLPHGGKGKLAIEFLKDQGWILLKEGYQTLLIYPDSS